MKILLTFLLLFSNTAKADCAKAVTYLKEGDTVVCTGYLFSPAKELEVRTKIQAYDKMTTLVETQDELITILKMEVATEQLNGEILKDQISAAKNQGELNKYVYFALGVILTGLIAYSTTHVAK